MRAASFGWEPSGFIALCSLLAASQSLIIPVSHGTQQQPLGNDGSEHSAIAPHQLKGRFLHITGV